MLQRIIEHSRNLKWGSAFLELFVIAIGLLMAFQVDRWWEGRADREREQQYIERLITDLGQDVINLEYAVELAALRRSFAETLIAAAEDPASALQNPVKFVLAFNQAAFTYTPALTSNTYEELKSTGNLALLRNTKLRNALLDYYRFDETQRQFQEMMFMQEFRHFELGAGILSNSMQRRSNDEWYVVSPTEFAAIPEDEVDPQDVLAAARRLQERPEFVAWLPKTFEMQIDLGQVNQLRLERATNLLAILHRN